MRLQFHQLAGSLENSLEPAYLIYGDEPLQLGEAGRLIRDAARARGFEERELLEVEAGFDWGRLAAASQAMSLFCSRTLIELRLGSASIGRDGSDAVRLYCDRPAEDNLLLILAPALGSKDIKSKWIQAVARLGVLVQVRPVQGERLVAWIDRRLRERGLQPEGDAASILAERVEGNLLAAANEVEKLALLHGAGPLDEDRLGRVIADSSRFDLFDVAGAALDADRARMHRVLRGLAAEGVAPSLVLWVLAREVRMLAAASYAARRGGAAFAAALNAHRVWESRRAGVRDLVRRIPLSRFYELAVRCATVDRQIKGVAAGDPWLSLFSIGDDLAGSAS
jgi:DNA polymerase-3 subunit delta